MQHPNILSIKHKYFIFPSVISKPNIDLCELYSYPMFLKKAPRKTGRFFHSVQLSCNQAISQNICHKTNSMS